MKENIKRNKRKIVIYKGAFPIILFNEKRDKWNFFSNMKDRKKF